MKHWLFLLQEQATLVSKVSKVYKALKDPKAYKVHKVYRVRKAFKVHKVSRAIKVNLKQEPLYTPLEQLHQYHLQRAMNGLTPISVFYLNM